MVEYFNLTGMMNSTNHLAVAQGTNTILGGYFFGWFTLFIIAFITFVTLKGKGYATSACFTVTCWFSMIIAWMLRAMSLIDNYTLWGVVGGVFILLDGSALVLTDPRLNSPNE